MNQLTAFRYQLMQHKKSIILFYIIVFCIILSLCLGTLIEISQHGVSGIGQISGFEMSSAIFLFVAGLNSFKDNFGMLLQNGVSRKTIYKSRIMVTLTIGLIMAIIDNSFEFILQNLPILRNKVNIILFYEQLYSQNLAKSRVWQMYLKSFFFIFFMYISFMTVGYFIALLFYKMDKRGKIAVGAGVPIILFIVLPSIDSTFFQGSIMYGILKIFVFAFGLSSNNSFYGIATFLILFLLFSIFSWGLLRKAMVKK